MAKVHSRQQSQRVFSREASRAVDREAALRYGIPSIVLMENAAIALREACLDLLRRAPIASREASILVICGGGDNGGDGYAVARHLHNARCAVQIIALGEPRSGSDARINWDICARMGFKMRTARDISSGWAAHPDIIIDAIFGTGLDRPVEGESREVIDWVNGCATRGSQVLAADIPSGLDCDTGAPAGGGLAVRAHRTVSFVGIKKGFALNPESRAYCGEIVIGDIGVPRELIEEFGEVVDAA